jgi:hypothetical protein
MTEDERMTIASRLYVRLRHSAGRTTDALWMIENTAYAREVLKLARASSDPELRRLADRFEWILFGGKPRNGTPVEPAPEPLNGSSEDAEERYTRSLR